MNSTFLIQITPGRYYCTSHDEYKNEAKVWTLSVTRNTEDAEHFYEKADAKESLAVAKYFFGQAKLVEIEKKMSWVVKG